MNGILGGSFDPVHQGHIDIATQLLDRHGFKKIYFVPAFQNPLKDEPHASSSERLKMLQLALQETGETRFELLPWEIELTTKSYTIDTVTRFTRELGDGVLILGNDAFSHFAQWKSPREILQKVSVLCFSRDPLARDPRFEVLGLLGITPTRAAAGTKLNTFPHRWVDWLVLNTLPFSSTEIRKQLSRGVHAPGLSPVVQRFIKDHSLYSDK